MIAWTYLDKRSAAADALRDYSSMEYIINIHPDDEADVRERMTTLPSSKPTGLPRVINPQANEARLVAQIDEIDVLKERYRQALEYMEWFKPAWEELSEDDRFVLEEFYNRDDSGQIDTIGNICDRFHIERTSAYNRKNRALTRLSILLYGKR